MFHCNARDLNILGGSVNKYVNILIHIIDLPIGLTNMPSITAYVTTLFVLPLLELLFIIIY